MNEIIPAGPAGTMSSVELVDVINNARELGRAELAHFTFLTKIEKVFGGDAKKFLGVYLGANGQERPCYHLPKRECQLMVMSESYVVQAKVYDRMAEMEAGQAIRVPTTLAGALRLAAEQAEQIESQALELAAAAPAVAFLDKYVEATGLLGFRQVCKLIRAKENQFREFLLKRDIWYRLGSAWVPHAAHINAGRCVVKAGVATANEHAFNSARFTTKGVAWVAGEWAKYQLGPQLEGM